VVSEPRDGAATRVVGVALTICVALDVTRRARARREPSRGARRGRGRARGDRRRRAELARAPRRIARATRRDATSDDEWRRRTASRLDSIKC